MLERSGVRFARVTKSASEMSEEQEVDSRSEYIEQR